MRRHNTEEVLLPLRMMVKGDPEKTAVRQEP